MPQHPDDDRWAQLNALDAAIDAEHEQLRAYVRHATDRLTGLHRQADTLREALGIHDVVIDTAPERHLRAVRGDAVA